ncbi:bacteriocin fulvocin C-related protein [Mucilaginibacter mali]|uniref:Bacteriocin fulvocin C-related protein n=1 Tax=Mucilaginibacter mali TaxID=2740462 RepID=A0A7D4TL13_9SPHI|nr:bacteriocin fulvocin C-related protein [Mucilaginibacter mali]QKJ29113.1 bacteriocin fulvocin C-related protein [Mucilaginibacter mali]
MKKVIFGVFTLCLYLCINSCKSNIRDTPSPISATSKEVNSEETNRKIQTILGMVSEQEQRLAVRTLTPAEKSALWKQHLNDFIQNGGFSIAQKNLLTELQTWIKPEFFTTEKHVKTAFESEWTMRAMAMFTYDEVVQTTVSLLPPNFNKKTSLQINTEFEGKKDCTCSDESDWCAIGKKCSKAIDCFSSQLGCGFFGAYDCVGLCALSSPE